MQFGSIVTNLGLPMDEIKDFQLKQHRKEIEMYQAGVTSGIRFVIDRFMATFDEDIRNKVVDLLLKEYEG